MNGQLSPRILQLVGLAMVIGSAVFWAFTNRESVVAFLSAGMTLATLGTFWSAQEQTDTSREYERPKETHPDDKSDSDGAEP